MRRSDREIKDFDEIIEVINKCDVCRLAINDGDYPYIVPMNFGLNIEDGKVVLYFHCASEGKKLELLRKNNKVAFEMDCGHEFILNDDKLKNEKEEFMKIASKDEDMSLYITSLRFLSECLEKYYGKKAIILIDEYDVPLENAFFEGFYKEMVSFLRSLFESALKTNPHLEFAILTGCLRISKESIFTGLNNLEIISILNKSYDEYFGFTNEEVKKICSDYNMESKYDVIKD